MKITCPNCHRILGDTEKDIDANLNCRGCKKTVRVCVRFTHAADYLKENTKCQEEQIQRA